MNDTRADAQRVLDQVILRQSPAERLATALRWSEDARAVALQALRQRDPEAPLLTLVEQLTNEPMRPMVRSGPRTAG